MSKLAPTKQLRAIVKIIESTGLTVFGNSGNKSHPKWVVGITDKITRKQTTPGTASDHRTALNTRAISRRLYSTLLLLEAA